MTYPRLIGALATIAAIALPTAATAQNSANTTLTGRVNTDPAASHQPVKRQTAKPATQERTASQRPAAASSLAPAAPQLATPASQRSRENPKEVSPFDPLKVDKDVSLGLQTSTQLKQYNFDDGRRIPGLENTTRNTPSYFGLSLSAPSESGTLFPPPLRLPRP